MRHSVEGNCFAQYMGAAWAPIQASLLKAQPFSQLGGFNPAICGTEDEDVCRRFAFWGVLITTTIACLNRGRTWNTSTNYLRAPRDTKLSCDNVLAEPGSFLRYNCLSKIRLLVWTYLLGVLEFSELEHSTKEIICGVE